jgi:putative cell wall-binding protein
MVYDAKTQQLLLFGGWHVPCGSVEGEYLSDTWSWNGVRWVRLHPATSPTPQAGGCAAYDPESGLVVLAGGGSDEFDHDTWAWDGIDWRRIADATPSNMGPVQGGCSMAFDPATGSIIASELNGDFPAMLTWLWTGSGWTAQSYSGPTGYGFATMTYDPQLGHVVLYHDEYCAIPDPTPCSSPGPYESQLWERANGEWTLLPAATLPTSRMAGGFGYDGGTGQLLVFGGQAGRTALTDTWVYGRSQGSTVVPRRLAGSDRDMTAVALSQATFPEAQSAPVVVLARDDEFADALVGGPLSVAQHGPLLLSPRSGLASVTRGELQRVLAPGGTVYVMGGTAALPSTVDDEVIGMGFRVARVAGANRFATAVTVANLLGTPSTVLEASGLNYPDALSAVPAAAKIRAAILLTDGGAQSAETAAYLVGHPGTRYAIGGAAAHADPNATAIAGADRYATNAEVARAFFPDATSFAVATGDGFADALGGGVLCAMAGEPMLLVGAGALPEPVHAFIATHSETLTSIDVVGGNRAVGDGVVTALEAAASDA